MLDGTVAECDMQRESAGDRPVVSAAMNETVAIELHAAHREENPDSDEEAVVVIARSTQGFGVVG
ncbi:MULTISPECIES: hypothetical protein [unclassified Streptomyces]|uniref:hypothetical protein n=1 Tax=unclassified Streptomyces TaxID=2593676 RepID=UPI001C9C89CE|nr:MULTISPECIES: hypothetical protein [unclassified Streptomyces]